ncbi:MAG: FAD-dependent oxidoreductase [Pseudomonadota bacterium]
MPLTDTSAIPRYKDLISVPKSASGGHHPVVIVGGGPVGLTLALDLGQRGHEVVLLNRYDFISAGSKAICFAKRTLDIWNRLGVAKRMVDKGVVWNVGKVFRGDSDTPVYQFDMQPVKHQEMPGFINLQQYYAEEFLITACAELPTIDLRWGHEVSAIDTDKNRLTVETAEGSYELNADWIVACDGSKSPIRTMMGLDFVGRVFEDNFLIADVKFKEQRPPERWFWFDPPWPGASALMHRQPDDIWRLDFQLGWDIDREAAVRPENVEPLVRGMLGDDVEFTEEWYSVYTFQCRRMERFVHDRIIFAGDAAHLVSPFGARGCNGGVADADNLAWKLDYVLRGGNAALIETYNEEAIATADENILNSSRSTDFMTPKTAASRALRDAVLDLAESHDFARPFVNSGRLSTPVSYRPNALVMADVDKWQGGVPPGSPAVDAPIEGALRDKNWLLPDLGGSWKLLSCGGLNSAPLPVVEATSDLARERYDLAPGDAYLIRPDQYVAARWKSFTADQLEAHQWPI